LWLALQARPAPTLPWAGGRLYSSPRLNVGARPALLVTPEERAVGVTVQVRLPLP